MASLRVGLTGGLASGKSTVARWLEEAGLRVVDADEIVASLYEPDGAGTRKVVELFGADVLKPGGAVDRPTLAERVFEDTEARRRLEAVIHPLVAEAFDRIANATGGIIVLEATLLVESGLAPHFDVVVTVEAEVETRRRRAIRRGLSEEAAAARLSAQGSGDTRRQGAHRTIHNNGSIPELREQVDVLIADLRELASIRED
jgi:dephospho-CoA kinase